MRTALFEVLMSTTHRWLIGITIAATSHTMGAQVRAADPPAKRAPLLVGISSVTDGDGNPIDYKSSAVKTIEASSQPQMVMRGRDWWPYATPFPTEASSPKRVEALTEEEIVVNGSTLLNVHDLGASVEHLPKELLLPPDSQLTENEGFYLVKIKGFSRTQAQIDALTQAGAVLGEYINVNTYIAKIPSSSFASVTTLPFVSFVGNYEPAYKISPRIGMEAVPVAEAIDAMTGHARPWALEVALHKGVYVDDVLNALGRLGVYPTADDVIANDAQVYLRVTAIPDAVPAIAMIPGVKSIAEKSYPKLLASAANPAAIPMVLQNNGVYTTSTGTGWKLWNAGIDGTGQIVTMMDSGLNTKMFHFSQDTVNHGTIGPSHRKVVGYDSFGGGNFCVADNGSGDHGHGAHTSQHAVGSISNMTSNPDGTHVPNAHWDNGIARGAKLYFQDIGTDAANTISPPADLGPSIIAAVNKGSFVQNHSWGDSTNAYDMDAFNLDAALFSQQDVVVTASAGNRGAGGPGTLGSPGTAKNAICVGGNDVFSPNSLFIDCSTDGIPACSTDDLGSSRGPVSGAAGRTKPDIMAFVYASSAVGGENMAASLPTAMCQTDGTKIPYFSYANTSGLGGTSFSAPEVAGLAALVRDYFQKGFYPTGTATPANSMTPSGSLVKAVILASGEPMNTTSSPSSQSINPRYSSDVGYGRANLPAALHIGAGAPFLWVQNNANLPETTTNSFFFNILGNGKPLRVMMAYYDAPGDNLQEDADLKVTIGGTVYLGNNFNAGWSTSGGTADRTNNTEGVFLDAAHGLPVSGPVRVDVIGFNNPNGMPYSLVVVGDVASQSVTQVTMEKGKYTCDDTVKITVSDVAATSPVSVTLVSKNDVNATIDTKIVSCTGSGGVFVGTIQTGSGITVAHGGSLTATYPGAIGPATATIGCQINATATGFRIDGGCDNSAAGSDTVTAPLFNAGSNEFYTKYMDAGEYTSYTFKFKNTTPVPLTDATVTLSFSGPAASKMSVFNNPVHIGPVGVDGEVGGVFQVLTDATAASLTSVNLDFDITSPGDGYTLARRLTQTQLLQTNDQVTRLDSCSTFNASLGLWAESTRVTHGVEGVALNTWHFGGAGQPTGSELRTDGDCDSAIASNSVAMTGGALNSGNFNDSADSFLFLKFQPVLRGNGPSGQPYRYAWKWHSFYHASETLGNQSGVWGVLYNNAWNNAAAPTGDQLAGFPIRYGYFYHDIFDHVGTWNWDVANGGTPDDPHFGPLTGGAPNQLIIKFLDVTGNATASTYFAYGHRHLDIWWINNRTDHGTHRDIALDNDRLVYDEFYATGQAGASCGGGGQVGQVAFTLSDYNTCPGTATLSVVDANGVSGMQVTVTSPGTLDSELVTLTGTAPYFTGTLTLSANSGLAVNNGVLFVLPSETINASYTDASPAGSSVARADTGCAGGDVVYVSKAQISDNGDNDGLPDNNETVTIDITVQNNLAVPLTNAKVTIFPASSTIDCITDASANYGTIDPGAQKTNPSFDRFTFHVNPSVQCSNAASPPVGRFIVVIEGDGIDAPRKLQSFTVDLDLDPTASGGAYTYTQNFNSDPSWITGITPDDTVPAPTCGPFVNDFHWCQACGNGSGGYGAWVGDDAFGTPGQNYSPVPNSSTLYSPTFLANGNVGLQFDVAYRTETTFDGGIVQYSLNGGSWTELPFATPAQSALGAEDACRPFNGPQVSWHGVATGSSWTATNTANVISSLGQTIQFRWRLGGDSSVNGNGYGGYGVDNVTITNLKQTVACEPTRNPGLPACPFCFLNPGAPCNDGNNCTANDSCTGGVCAGTPITAPAEVQGVAAAANKTTYSWTATPTATLYDVVRGALSALPVGPGGGDETCFGNLAVASVGDATTPAPNTGFWYLTRAENSCGIGTYGTRGVSGSPGAPRVTTTCP